MNEPLPMPPASGQIIEVFPRGQRAPGAAQGLGTGTGEGVGAGDGEGAPLPSPPPADTAPPPAYEETLRQRQRVAVVERARSRRQPVQVAPEPPAEPAEPSEEAPDALAQVRQAVDAIDAARPPRRGTLAGGGARGRQVAPENAPTGEPAPRLTAREIMRHMADAAGGVVSGNVAAIASVFEAGADLADVLDAATGMATEGADPAQAPGRVIGRAIRSIDPFQQRTVSGEVSREVTQTLVGFFRGARLMRLAGFAQGGGMVNMARRGAAAGMIADALFQEAEEGNIADALVRMGVERSGVVEFFASDPADSAAEARLRNALSGAFVGAGLDAVFATVRGARAVIQARRQGGAAPQAAGAPAQPGTLAEAAEVAPNEMRDRIIVGDQQRPLFERVAEARAASDAATEGLDGPVVAAQLEYAGQAAGRPGPNVFINWGRIRTSDDVQAVLRDMAEAFQGDVVAAQRGVQSNEETARLARQMGLTPEELIARQPGQALNAEQAFAARMLYTASGEQLLRAAQAAAAGGAGALEQAAFRRMMSIHHAIQSSVLGARSEAGRALQQWSIPAGAPAQQMRQIEDMLRDSGGSDVSARMARMLSNLAATSSSPEEAMRRISTFSRAGATGRTIEAAHAYWLNAILSDPSTHFFNIVGNQANMMMTLGERAWEAQLGRAMGRGMGDRAEVGEASAMLYGMSAAFLDSLRLAGRTYMDDGAEIGAILGRSEAPRASSFSTRQIFGRGPALDAPSRYALGIDPGTRVGRGVDWVGHNIIGAPGRALGAEDAFFKSMLYRGELHALTMRRALGNLTAELGREPTGAELGAAMARLMRDLPPDLQQEAAESAIYRTFNNSSEFSRGLQALMATRNPMANFAVRTVIPFPRTMVNILAYGAERSPIAPIINRWQEDFAAGGVRQTQAIARMSLGSGMMLLAYQLTEQGVLTGGGEGTFRGRAAGERQGELQYAMRFGDVYVSYNRLDPIGFLFGAAADLHHLQTNREITGDSAEDVRLAERDLAVFIANALESRSIFNGVARVFQSLERGNFDPYIAGVIGPFVAGPNITAGIAITQDDDTQRDARSLSDRMAARRPDVAAMVPEAMQEQMRAMQANLTRIRSQTLPRRNVWGEIDRRGIAEIGGSEFAGTATSYITRGQVRRAAPNPIDAELQRLRYAVSPVSDVMVVRGVAGNIRQFPEALDRLRVLTGHAVRLSDYGNVGMKQALIDMVEGRGPLGARYAAAPDAGTGTTKRGLIAGVAENYRRAAREQLLREFPEIGEHIAGNARNPDLVRTRRAPGMGRGGEVSVDPPAMR